MYYKREFQSGPSYDPRQKTFGVFGCDACGNEEFVEMKQLGLFDRTQARPCPKCKSFGKSDLINNLHTKKSLLEKEELRIKREIEKVLAELDQLVST